METIRPLSERTKDRDIRESIREARVTGKLAVAAAVLGCTFERLREIDDGALMTETERRWFWANLDMSGE